MELRAELIMNLIRSRNDAENPAEKKQKIEEICTTKDQFFQKAYCIKISPKYRIHKQLP
jgi:hypothetical protein